MGTHFGKLAFQREPAHTCHPDIEHEAAGARGIESIQERLSRLERLGRESDRDQEFADRLPHACVVIDDEDGGLAHALVSLPFPRLEP